MSNKLVWGQIAVVALALAFGMLFMRGVRAQEHHQYHNDYQNWASEVTNNCCNNQDCSDIAEDRVRENAGGTQINIDGQWCPVELKHRIIRGKSPDWSKYHACIQPDVAYSTGKKPPCERLLCFVTKGGGV